MVHFQVNLGNITVILGEINAARKRLRNKTQPHLKGHVLYLGRNTPIFVQTKSSAVIWMAAQQDREDKPPSTSRNTRPVSSESHLVNILWISPQCPAAWGALFTQTLFTCCNLSATLKGRTTASLFCERHRSSEGIFWGLHFVARMRLC